jgi:methionyl-tRNA formyltransferase
MKIIYMGTPELSCACLEHLHRSRHEIVLVVTQPDRPGGRGRKPAAPPVKLIAQSLGLPLIQPESLTDEAFHDVIARHKADVMVVLAFSILPATLFPLTKYRAVNMHASLLPRYRGAAPIPWAIANGEKETGVTLFQLDAEIDHGLVLGQARVTIGPEETTGELGPRLVDAGKKLMLEVLDDMEKGVLQPEEQDHSLATRAPKLKKEDGLVDWNMPAEQIYNRVRAFNPYPVCFTHLPHMKNRALRIYRAGMTDKKSPGPGHADVSEDGFPMAGCKDRMLKLLQVQLEGKPVVSGDAFLNGVQDRSKLAFE